MTRVGLARTRPTYEGVVAPFCPGSDFPELRSLLGDPQVGADANHVYAGVRAALLGAGLDTTRFGSADWNPLSDLVSTGGRVVLKPNFIRHWNPEPGASVESVITHGAILRAIADYAFLAVGSEGQVEIAEAPQMDCDFDRIREIVGLDTMVEYYREAHGLELVVIDLRRESVVFEDGIIVSRKPLPGDPRGYRAVDLGERSFFTGSGLDPNRLRGADYDSRPTGDHHRDGRNEYLLSETVLSADLVVNLPKLKTHKKTGVTLALKNLVGINGDKNWLPHHCLGSVSQGGDEFPSNGALDRLRSRAIELARPLLSRGIATPLFRLFRRVESSARGDDFIRSGNWHGNQTTWRMCLDLNRCFYYSDAEGLHLDAPRPVRRALTLLDGIVAGQGNGPLSPTDRPLGAVIASTDPVAVDLAAIRLMGFDEARLPKICEAMADTGPRVTEVRRPEQVSVIEVSAEDFGSNELSLEEISSDVSFEPHVGWKGSVERTTS
jgi:uncharacterized protein (DUF362 family)